MVICDRRAAARVKVNSYKIVVMSAIMYGLETQMPSYKTESGQLEQFGGHVREAKLRCSGHMEEDSEYI